MIFIPCEMKKKKPFYYIFLKYAIHHSEVNVLTHFTQQQFHFYKLTVVELLLLNETGWIFSSVY